MKDKIMKFLGYKKILIIQQNNYSIEHLDLLKKTFKADLVMAVNTTLWEGVKIQYV